MLAWIEDDLRPVGASLARSLHEWKAVLALYTSARERRPVSHDGFTPSSHLIRRLIEETKDPGMEHLHL